MPHASRPVAAGLLTVALAGLVALGPATPARAAGPLQVTTTGVDNPDCSANPCRHLQFAIDQASALPGNVTIDVGPGVYDPTTGTGGFDVPSSFAGTSLTLDGSGSSITILHTGDDGAGNGWGIRVETPVPVTVRDLRITSVTAPVGPTTTDAHVLAGMWDSASSGTPSLTVDAVRIEGLTGAAAHIVSGNCIRGVDVSGITSDIGAVDVTDTHISDLAGGAGITGCGGGNAGGVTAGAVTVRDSEVVGLTTASDGDPLQAGGALGIVGNTGAVTVSGTTVARLGGGVVAIGIFQNGSAALTVSDSTVSVSPANVSLLVADVASAGSTVTLTHVTLIGANNGLVTPAATTISASLLDTHHNCSGTVVDGGGNVASPDGNSCGFGASSDSAHVFRPGELGPLQNNGGPTDTIQPAAWSTIGHQVSGASGFCGGNDQRGPGFARPSAACAAGAVEPAAPTGSGSDGPVGGARKGPGHSALPGCGALTDRPDC